MIGVEDAISTYEYKEHYKILPVINGWADDSERIKDGAKVPEGFEYNSLNNKDWMSIKEVQDWLVENEVSLGKI